MAVLTEAMLTDDTDRVSALIRSEGLTELPTALISMPPGATVVRNGENLGTTPLVVPYDGTPADEIIFDVTLDGYQPTTISALGATGGWRLQVDLVRAPVLDHQLDGSITSTPAAVDGMLYVTGSRGVYSVATDGTTAFYPAAGTGGVVTRPFSNPVYAPAVGIDGAVYVVTRERYALRIAGAVSERLIQPVGSDFEPVRYVSPNILDREVLIVSGRNGRLVGADVLKPETPWQSANGAAFAGSPVLVEDRVLAVREDGNLVSLVADNGDLLGEAELGNPVLAAWSGGDAIEGYTSTHWFRWDGNRAVVLEALPRPIKAASSDLIVTIENRVLRGTTEVRIDPTTEVQSRRTTWKRSPLSILTISSMSRL